jgi:hypothetical protein
LKPDVSPVLHVVVLKSILHQVENFVGDLMEVGGVATVPGISTGVWIFQPILFLCHLVPFPVKCWKRLTVGIEGDG